jgi:predicted nucleic acid-binding protein
MIVCDTSGLIAYFDASDAHHDEANAAVEADSGPFVVSPYVLAELDYLVATRRGVREELAVLTELAGGAWDLPACAEAEVRRAAKIIGTYRDQNIGLTDASLVVLAASYRTDRLLTLDHRHFRVIRTLDGKPFTLLP